MDSKIMLGVISFLKPGMKFLEARIKYHAQQLSYWEDFPEDIPFYRVEIFWDETTRSALSTDLDLHSIIVNEPSPPGKSRNFLLKALYASDCDYLVCCDDDQVLDPGNEGFDFLQNLPVSLAKDGALITFQNETWITKGQGYKMVSLRQQPVARTSHLLSKAICTGNMQISCIPNLVKYGYEPVFFDEDTMAQEGEIPEDAKFQADWLVAGHPVYRCDTLFNVALDSYIQSSIYKSGRYRYTTNKTRIKVLNDYIHSLCPQRADITSLETLSQYKNTAAATRLVPRVAPMGRLIGEEELLSKSTRKSRIRPRKGN